MSKNEQVLLEECQKEKERVLAQLQEEKEKIKKFLERYPESFYDTLPNMSEEKISIAEVVNLFMKIEEILTQDN